MNTGMKHPFLFALFVVILFLMGIYLGASPVLSALLVGLYALYCLLEARGGISQNKERIGDFFWGLSILPRGFLAAGALLAPVFGVLVLVFDVSPESALLVLAYPFVWLGVSLSISLWSILGEERDSKKGRPYVPGKRP